jgi:hypothetical protein
MPLIGSAELGEETEGEGDSSWDWRFPALFIVLVPAPDRKEFFEAEGK